MFLANLSLIKAQVSPSAYTLSTHQISTEDGLPSNEVYQVFQDDYGYIWFATDVGVSRYNGREFTNFSTKDGLVDNTVFGFYEDYKKRLWLRSFSGKLCYFARGTDSVYSYVYNEKIEAKLNGRIPVSHSCNSENIVSIGLVAGQQKDGSDLLQISENGQFSFPERFENDTSFAYVLDNDNELIYGTSHGKKSIEDPGRICFFEDGELTYQIDLDQAVERIYPCKLSENHYAIGCASNDVIFIRNKQIYNSISFPSRVLSVYQDKQEKLWVGTENGVYFYKYGLNNIPLLVLANRNVSDVMEDLEGNIWCTTLNDGIHQILSKELLCYTPEIIQRNATISCIEIINKGEVLLGTSNGIIEAVKNEYAEVISVGPDHSYTNDLHSIGQDSIFVAYDGRNQLSFAEVKMKQLTGFICQGITKFVEDSVGGALLGCSRSGVRWFGANGEVRTSLEEGFTERIYDACVDRNGITWLAGLNRLWKYEDTRYESCDEISPLLHNRINAIEIGKEDRLIMASSENGLIIKDGEEVFAIGENNGLKSDMCLKLLLLDNEIWVGTNYGLGKITIEQWKPLIYKIKNYDAAIGFPVSKVTDIKELDGEMYVTYADKLVRFFPDELAQNKRIPKLKILDLMVSGKPMNERTNLSLKHDQNDLVVRLEALTFRNMDQVLYKYRFVGKSETWRTASTSELVFESLTPDSYELEVVAVNENDIESTSRIIHFTIRPPWWKTTWFVLLAILFLLVIGWGAFAVRIRTLKNRTKTANRIIDLEKSALQAQMNPHFIFNSLNSIQKYISENDKRNAQKYLNRFARLIRLILESSRSDSFLLEDEITLLDHYLSLEANRFKGKFRFEIVADDLMNEDFTRIPPMIIQPFVENAIIHGMNGKQETGQIRIQFQKNETGSILCVVDDDGVGRKVASRQPNKAKQHKPVGVLIAKERLGHLNHGTAQDSDVTIIDKYDDQGESIGTRVEIKLPILAS